MTKTPTKWRKAARWLTGLFVVAGAGVLLLPVWFPWVLKPVLAHYGIRFATYDRLGYARFALTGVKGAWGNASVEASRVESVIPTVWLWQRFQRDTNSAPVLVASDWRVVVERSEPGVRAQRTNSMLTVLDTIVPIAAVVQRELPLARLTNGVVEGEGWRIVLPVVVWSRGSASGGLQVQSFPETIRVSALFENKSTISLTASLDAHNLGVVANLNREPTTWVLQGQATWLTNRAEFSATFDQTGWWPAEARLDAEQLRVPAQLLRLQGYEDPTASVAFSAVSNEFQLQAAAVALPSGGTETVARPEIEVAVRVRGNPALATLEQFEIRTPWLLAGLTNTFGIRKGGTLLTNAARLDVALDLGKLPGGSLTGKVDGIVRVEFAEGPNAAARFEFSAENLSSSRVEATRIHLNGLFGWPLLTLDEFKAELGDGSEFSVAGAIDLAARRVNEAKWRFAGKGGNLNSNRIGRLALPVKHEMLVASGRVEGAFTNLMHSGAINMTKAEVRPLKPFDARVEWQGTNLNFTAAKVELNAGDSVLALTGKFSVRSIGQPTEVQAGLETASFRRSGAELYSLARPVTIRFQGAAANGSQSDWNLSVSEVEWTGGERRASVAVDLDWPARGRAKASAHVIALGDFSDFIPAVLTNISLAELNLDAGWTNGPVQSVLKLDATMATANDQTLRVNGTVRSGAAIKVDQLTLTTEYAPALLVDGTLPVALTPGATNGWLTFTGDQPLDLRADLKSVESLTLHLGSLGEAKFSHPQLQVKTSGTLEAPSASVNVIIPRVEWQSRTNGGSRPGLEEFQLNIAVSPRLIELKQLAAKLDGQGLLAQGEWPLPAGFWEQLLKDKQPPDWSAARGQLQITNAQLAALARYVPSALAPEGNVSVDLKLEPGRKLEGAVLLTNAATRPIGNVSPLRDVAARVRFTGDRAALEEFRGHVGGQPVQATGQLRLTSGRLWEYQVNLQGSNVPLARSPEFLLRGDFELQLKGGGEQPAQLSGIVNLQDGLYVQHATALMLSRPERPALRPPYFSVTNQPFAEWKLDLSLRGDRFLRVRTPVFNGIVSANLKLDGTLREPVATGDARVNSGRVLFPFGTLQVDRAFASLDGNDPRGPDLLINASGRNYRYELRLEVSGPVDGARIVFSSTPPLSSEEILLLLTAGEVPRDEQVFSTQTRAGRLATFLGKDFLSRYSGNDMEGGRLIINTGENLTEEGETTYSIEYRLTDRWSLLGEYDRFSAVNAAVKWRIFSR